jgi:hypothetical protein
MQIYQPSITGSLSISGSINLSGSISLSSGSVMTGTASLATTASYAISATDAVTAQTASFANAFTVAGTLTAQTLVVQTITSSVDFVTGSTRFGSIIGNTHQFTGSVGISGSLSGASAVFSGNVGIGTASPSDILDVQKNQNATTNFYFRNTNTTDANSRAYLNLISGASSLVFKTISGDHSYIDATSNLYFQSAGSVKMTMLSSGNVGIGTNSPYFPLQVSGDISSINNGSNISKYFFSMNSTPNTSYTWIQGDGRSSGYIGFITNDTEKLQLTSDGYMIFAGSATTSLGRASFENNDSRFAIYSTQGGGTTKDILFQAGGSASAPNMTFKANGNLLIGTTTDSGYKLQVNGAITTTGIFRTNGTNTLNLASTGINYLILNYAFSGMLAIRDNTTGGSAVYLLDPNLGVNTISTNLTFSIAFLFSGGAWYAQRIGGINTNIGFVPYGNN